MIKFLVIFFIVIYALAYLGRYLLTRFIRNAASQAGRNATYRRTYSNRKEGSVTVENNKSSKKHFSGSDGEYVDYEEVK